MNETQYETFISYASQDRSLAEQLRDRLKSVGFRVWFDTDRLEPGCDWHRDIETACEASRVILPVLTPRWKLSDWTRFETYGHDVVIPLWFQGGLDEVFTSPLRRFQADVIDFTHTDEHDWQRLFDLIRAHLARPAPDKPARLTQLRHRHNPHFVGREAKLSEIHEKLWISPTAALAQAQVQVVTALGGTGKTTLARAYAEKFWRLYPQMFWVDCRVGIVDEFATIHDLLFPERANYGLKPEDRARRALQDLREPHGPRRLLILDDALDEQAILDWIPTSGRCHTLITSRFTAWSSIPSTQVWVLESEPARQLLLRRAGRDWETLDEDECDACDDLAKRLGYLPLALEQAAAYIGAPGIRCRYREYLALYATAEKHFLELQTSRGSTDYPASVYATWRTTIDRLPVEPRAILRLAAFMAATPIPKKLFVSAADIVIERAQALKTPESASGELTEAGSATKQETPLPVEVAVPEWVGVLAAYSMIQDVSIGADGAFSIHNLVQAVERHTIEPLRQSVDWLKKAMQCFVRFAPPDGQLFEDWQIWRMLLPHGDALRTHARFTDGVESDAELLIGLSGYKYSQGHIGDAACLAREALELREQMLGPEHSDTLLCVNNLAVALYSNGDYDEAESLLRRAVESDEKVLGQEHRSTLRALNNLAGLLVAKSDFAEAEQLICRALKIQERVLGSEHPDTLLSVATLGDLLYTKGDFATAEPFLHRAMEGRERVLGHEHPDTLKSVNNMSALLFAKGDYVEAEPLIRRTLDASELMLGKEHPDVLNCVNNLAVLLHAKGDHAAAEPHFRQALDARERVLGIGHPDTLISVAKLAELLRTKGDYIAAELLLRRALEGRERMLGKEHLNTLRSVDDLAALLFAVGEYAEAESLLRRELEARERVQGREHAHTMVVLRNLAEFLRQRRRFDEAEPLFQKMMSLLQQSRGPTHPDVAWSMNKLSAVQRNQGRLDSAYENARGAAEIWERADLLETSDNADCYSNLGAIEHARGKLEEARAHLRRAIEMDERLVGKEDSGWAIDTARLAHVEYDLARRDGLAIDTASELMRSAWPILRSRVPKHTDTQKAAAWLAENDRDWFQSNGGEP